MRSRAALLVHVGRPDFDLTPPTTSHGSRTTSPFTNSTSATATGRRRLVIAWRTHSGRPSGIPGSTPATIIRSTAIPPIAAAPIIFLTPFQRLRRCAHHGTDARHSSHADRGTGAGLVAVAWTKPATALASHGRTRVADAWLRTGWMPGKSSVRRSISACGNSRPARMDLHHRAGDHPTVLLVSDRPLDSCGSPICIALTGDPHSPTACGRDGGRSLW